MNHSTTKDQIIARVAVMSTPERVALLAAVCTLQHYNQIKEIWELHRRPRRAKLTVSQPPTF